MESIPGDRAIGVHPVEPVFMRAAGVLQGRLLIVYLPVFWNLIPTVIVHRHYCGMDAGFKALVSPQDWARQNPLMIERLRGVDLVAWSTAPVTADGYSRTLDFGGTLGHDLRVTKVSRWGVDVTRVEKRIADVTSAIVLAKATDYGTGRREDLTIWLTRGSCFEPTMAPVDKLIQFTQSMKEQVK